jgi:crossover junction endodeoxyribonuclease RuvC
MKAVLGLDPGLRHTGWAVVVADDRGALSLTASGVIDVPPAKLSMAARLSQLFDALQSTLQPLAFDEAGGGGGFCQQKCQKLANPWHGAGGGDVGARPAWHSGLRYPTNLVKKCLSGFGHADKAQVQQMLRLVMAGADNLRPDAADAAAVALCHWQHRQLTTAA